MRIAGLEAKLLFERIQNGRCALKVARGSGTHHTTVRSRRAKGEMVVEGGYTIDLRERNREGIGQLAQGGVVQVTPGLLYGVHGLD
jgi:hypothetical protein